MTELAFAAGRRAGHATQPFVEAVVPLAGDLGRGLLFGCNAQPLFGLDRLVETVLPGAIGENASRAGIDDLDVAVGHHIVNVPAE